MFYVAMKSKKMKGMQNAFELVRFSDVCNPANVFFCYSILYENGFCLLNLPFSCTEGLCASKQSA